MNFDEWFSNQYAPTNQETWKLFENNPMNNVINLSANTENLLRQMSIKKDYEYGQKLQEAFNLLNNIKKY